MSLLQTVLIVILYAWMFTIAGLLFRIWRIGETRMLTFENTLVSIALQATETAKISVDTNNKLLAAIGSLEQHFPSITTETITTAKRTVEEG